MQYPDCPEMWGTCKTDSNKNLMIVGKMPGEWLNSADTVEEGMAYRMEVDYKVSFFQFIKNIVSIINGVVDNPLQHCYWSNIFRMATKNPQINKQKLVSNENYEQEYIDTIRTLPREIEIMEPDIIFFCTGPGYDKYLKKIFSCTFQPVNGYPENFLSEINIPSLPGKKFRTYHPEHLRFYKKEEIINLLRHIKKIV